MGVMKLLFSHWRGERACYRKGTNSAYRILLLSLSFFLLQAARTCGRPEQSVEFVLHAMRGAVDDEIAADSPLIHKPEFEVTSIGDEKQLTIKRGNFELLGFGDDLYSFPFAAEMNIELLRRALSNIDPAILAVENCGASSRSGTIQSKTPFSCRDRLSAVLDSAESHVAKMVSLLVGEHSPALRSKLVEEQKAIDDLLGRRFYDLVESAAESKGIDTFFVRGGTVPEPISVEVGSVPNGAKISLMTELAFRRQGLSNVAENQWPWTEVVQNPMKLLGRYRYKAQWPDGTITQGMIDVRSASPIRISEK
jgi:hypothetical protein